MKTPTKKTAVALGLFDGVHHGHRKIINRAAELSESGFVPSVFTFETESVKIKHGKPLEYICPNSVKLELMRICGIEHIYSPSFDEVKGMSGEEFVSEILVRRMNAGAVICGEDFRFGKNASWGVGELKELAAKHGIAVEVIALDGFSSEKYREMLLQGRVEELAVTGDSYIISAEVVQGNRIGRTLDFPTINQHFAEGQLVPKHGVYETATLIGGRLYPSVTNIGVRPTVGDNIKPLAETHIIGYSGDLYGYCVDVAFRSYIRGEMRFASLEELKNRVFADIACVKERFEAAETSGKD